MELCSLSLSHRSSLSPRQNPRGRTLRVKAFDSPAESYAPALADVVVENGTLEATAADLEKVAKLFSDPEVSEFFRSPVIVLDQKQEEQAKVSELRGYTGKPLYSVWFGAESEERAVFVDEVKCVGCLKCTLIAEKTFAVESVYGRARVVAQWADPENKVQEAMDACPVDSIS